MTENEEWRNIEGWPGYKVSNLGRVSGPRGHIIKLTENTDGYLRVGLSNGPVKKLRNVHILVCEAFHGKPPFDGAIVLHGPDHSKANCRADNVRWGTYAENMADSAAVGNGCGERNGNAKLDWDKVRYIRRRASEGESASAIARSLGVSPQLCSRIIRGLLWKENTDANSEG